MNCYDCATLDHLARSAVGVCHDCGAAMCETHAVTRAHHLTRPAVSCACPLTRRLDRCPAPAPPSDAAYAAVPPCAPDQPPVRHRDVEPTA